MAKNKNLTDLDFQPAFIKCIDAKEDALRVLLNTETDLEIQLDAADGDSVLTLAQSESHSIELASESPYFGVAGFSKIAVYAEKLSELAAELELRIEASPLEEGSLWAHVASMPVSKLANVEVSDIIPFLARRIKIIPSRQLINERVIAHIVLSA